MAEEPICPLDRDIQQRLAAVGSDLEQDLRHWIETLSGEKFPPGKNFGAALKNGILLCKLANGIRPGICPKIQTATAPFVQMENINAFLKAERTFGVPAPDLFMTVDLFEEKNIGQVIRSLATLKRITGATTPAAGGGGSGGSSSSSRSAPAPVSHPPRDPAPAAGLGGGSSSSGAGRFCTQCGVKGVSGAKFCGECGAKI